MPATRRLPAAARRGFTLIELLVVIGIIGVLMGLSLVVGNQLVIGSKQRLTRDAITVLDQALQQYIAEQGENPDPLYNPYANTQNPPESPLWPVADCRDMQHTATSAGVNGRPGNAMINSVGFFYAQASAVPNVKAILTKLPAKLVHSFDPDNDTPGSLSQSQPALMTVFDAWDRPIRYVHPVYQGVVYGSLTAVGAAPTASRPTRDITGPLPPTQSPLPAYTFAADPLRRNNVATGSGSNAQDLADGDGGMCVGYRPYFYSSGPDRLVGVLKDAGGKVTSDYNQDNIYTTRPNFVDKAQ